MNQTDIGAYIKSVKGVNPTNSGAATINGAAIDRQGFLSCELHHACGAASGGPSARTVDCKLQDSADGSNGWADYNPDGAGSGAAAQLSTDNAEARKAINLASAKRYIRVVETVAFTGGSSPAIPVAATVVLGGADQLPQA
jgi:hypothetical protein